VPRPAFSTPQNGSQPQQNAKTHHKQTPATVSMCACPACPAWPVCPSCPAPMPQSLNARMPQWSHVPIQNYAHARMRSRPKAQWTVNKQWTTATTKQKVNLPFYGSNLNGKQQFTQLHRQLPAPKKITKMPIPLLLCYHVWTLIWHWKCQLWFIWIMNRGKKMLWSLIFNIIKYYIYIRI